MQLGPYLHPHQADEDVWRMASEDSGMQRLKTSQSFLLIFCTGRIVTERARDARRVPPDTPDVPANSQIFNPRVTPGQGSYFLP
jgi:hypothetical protein